MTLSFYALEFDAKGHAADPAQLEHLIAESKRGGVTDLIFLAHGFRCSDADATGLYMRLLTNLWPHLADVTGRTFAVAGVYWPSQEFRESRGTAESVRDTLSGLHSYSPDAIDHAESLLDAAKDNRNAQDQFVASALSAFDDGHADPTEGLPLFHQWPGSELLDKLRTPFTGSKTDDEGGIESIPMVNPVLNGIDTFLNFLSWYAMKNLSGEVGANGLAVSVLAVQRELAGVRRHLVGHSLGGRLMTACCKSLGHQGAQRIDSLSLLEAAFSHFGFSPDAGWGQPGFFREVVDSQIVRGPIISTFSKQDAIVGKAYAIASRLTDDRLQAIGDASDPYGGIGHNGAQRTPESIVAALHEPGESYQFRPGIVTCLDGSEGMITGHGDVTNPHVAYAIASAVCARG